MRFCDALKKLDKFDDCYIVRRGVCLRRIKLDEQRSILVTFDEDKPLELYKVNFDNLDFFSDYWKHKGLSAEARDIKLDLGE